MVDKKVAINVQLKLDSEEFSRKVDGLSNSFKPLEVPVKLQSLGLSTGPLKIKADIDPNSLTPSLTASLKGAFGSVTAKLGEDIGEQVGKSVEKLKPSAFSNIIGAIATPFQKIATGALEGVGREMSAKLGQGLAKGVEKQVAPVIGSFDLLGEKLVTTAAPRLGNTIGGKLAKSLFNKDSVKQAQADFKQFLTSTVGEADALVASQSQKAKTAQEQQANLLLARQELGRGLAEFVAATPQRQQQTTQLRTQDTQLSTQQQTAQEKVVAGQTAIASKRQELAQKQEQILKKLASQGVKVDDTLKLQIAKQVQSAPKTVQELAKLEIELAKSSQALTAIFRQRQNIQNKIKQLSAPISPIVRQLELLGVNQAEIKAVREKIANTNSEFDKVATTLNSSINENISTIQNLRQEIQIYKQQLQALVTDYNFQLNFVSSKEEQSQLLQQVIQQRNEIVKQIEQAEKDIAVAVSKVKGRQELRQQTQNKQASKVRETEQEYTDAQIKVARQAMGGGRSPTATSQQPTGNQLFPDAFAQKLTPEIYQQIASQVAKLSGVKIRQSDLPSIAYNKNVPEGGAAYAKKTNQILLDKASYQQLVSGNVSKQVVENIAHELRHALQFAFGKDLSGGGVNLLTTTQEQQARLSPRISGSVAMASKGVSQQEQEIIQKTEVDAYAFADRYAESIYNYVKRISNPQNIPSLKTKLTERQKELNTVRDQSQEKLFASLTEENKAALEQLTGKQLQAIARSSGVKGYSNKKVAELRQMLLQQINPEDLAFKIPLFSKVNPQVQQDAAALLKLPQQQIKQELTDTNRYFGQAIKVAAKKGKIEQKQELTLILDGITEARKIYASALAQNLDEQTRGIIQAAIATLGKQRIAAQNRLTNANSTTATTNTTSVSQGVSDLQFALPAENIPPLPAPPPPPWVRSTPQQQPKFDLSFDLAKARRDEREAKLKGAVQNAQSTQEDITKLVDQINQQVLQGLITADVATKKIADLTRKQQAKADKQAKKQQAVTTKSAEASFKQAQQALKQLEVQVDQQIAQIEAKARYNQQQQQRKLEARLTSYGIDQTAPVDIGEQRPQGKPFSVGGVFNKLKSEFQDFRASLSRKQAQVLGQQSQAILVDLDSQIAIGKASVAESKTLQKQITENEKRIQQIIAKVKASKEGRIPAMTQGDLQRLSGELQQLSAQVDADKARVAELQPQIERGRRLQPVAKDLRGASKSSEAIASQKNISGDDLKKLDAYNQKVRESLKLLGQNPPNGPGGFFADLNLKMPGLLKNVLNLVKGFLAFQVVSMVQQQLQQLAVTAFQTSLRFEQLEKSLNFATGGEGAKSLEFVRKEVERLSLPLETSIKAFTGLTAAARGTALEGAQTEKIFSAVAQAARVYNLTTEQQEGALLALQQMISKGTVQAEELRGQLGERLPGAFQIAARSMGVTTAQLSKMLELGQVTAEDFLPKFVDQLSAETSGGVAGATKSAAASLQRLNNSFTDLNRKIGDAISPAAVALLDGLAGSLDYVQQNAKVVKAVLVTLALGITIALIPSITALGAAIWTLATVALPAASAAMLAIVAANPVLIASFAALAVGMLVAEDGARALANALNGVSQAQIDAADSDAKLDFKYNEALKQLAKQVPLTREKIDELTAGLDDQARRGVNSAKTSELLKTQLLKLQTQAEATAKSQAELNKRLTESDLAFKKARGAADLLATERSAALASAKGKGQLGEDAIRDREYEAEQQQNLRLSSLYSNRIAEIKNLLIESERLRKLGKKGLEAKEEIKLNEELINVQSSFNQTRINLGNTEYNRLKEIRDRRIKDFDEAQSIIESKQRSGIVTEEQLLQKRLEIQQRKGKEQLRDIQERRANLNATDKEGLEALAVEEAAARASIKESQKTAFDQRLALSQKRSDQELAIAQSSHAKGLINETQFNQEQFNIRVKYLDDQLTVLKARRATISASDIDTQNEIKAKEAQILKDRAEARKTLFESQLSTAQKLSDNELSVLQLNRSRGLITETQFNQQQYDTRTKFLDQQLELVRQRSQAIASTDIDAQKELKAKEAQLLQQRTDERKRFLDEQLRLLEREQQKSVDLATLAAKEREIELQKLVKSGVLSQEEIQERTFQITRQSIEEQLQLEQQKLQKLQSFSRYDDPAAEEERQGRIRASRIRTADLQLQLLQNEKSQQETNSRIYERLIAQINNRATAATQSFTKELQLNTAIEKSLQLQNQLLDAQKNLRSALSSYVDAELQVLQETATTEREKEQLAESAANIKLQAARQQIELDRQSLELQIQQAEQAQRRLEVENAIAQIRNKADIATKQAEAAKVAADPNATTEQKEAAQLQVIAAQQEGDALRQEAGFLAQQRAVGDRVNQMKRDAQNLQSSGELTRAEFEAANIMTDPFERRRRLDELRGRASERLFGANADTDWGEFSNRLDDFNRANRGEALTPLQAYRASVVQNRVSPSLPQIELPKVIPMLNATVDNLGVAVDSLIQLVQQKLSIPTTVTVSTPINNYFPASTNAKDAASKTTQEVRKQIYDLGIFLEKNAK